MSYKCLVVGAGSIGKRTIDNLIQLGHTVSAVEISKERSSLLKTQGYKVYSTIDEAFSEDPPEICFICTPTETHIPIAQTLATKKIKGLFIEKPLSYSIDCIQTLKNMCNERGIKLGCGCNLLYLKGIKLLKILIDNKSIGNRIICVDYLFSHDLRLWNPERDYRKTYSHGIGGGALLEDSHAITLINNIFGYIIPEKSKGILLKSGLLEIDNEDVSESIHITDKGIICRIHSSLISNDYIRNLQIIGNNGIIQWEMNKINKDNIESYVYIKTPAFSQFRTFNVSEPLNNMFLEEIVSFLNFVSGKIDHFNDGIQEMVIIDKIKRQNEIT